MPPDPLLRYWTLYAPNGDVITCELVRTAAGLEVRCHDHGPGENATDARTASIRAVTDALNLAEAWKAAYVARGWSVRTGGQPPT